MRLVWGCTRVTHELQGRGVRTGGPDDERGPSSGGRRATLSQMGLARPSNALHGPSCGLGAANDAAWGAQGRVQRVGWGECRPPPVQTTCGERELGCVFALPCGAGQLGCVCITPPGSMCAGCVWAETGEEPCADSSFSRALLVPVFGSAPRGGCSPDCRAQLMQGVHAALARDTHRNQAHACPPARSLELRTPCGRTTHRQAAAAGILVDRRLQRAPRLADSRSCRTPRNASAKGPQGGQAHAVFYLGWPFQQKLVTGPSRSPPTSRLTPQAPARGAHIPSSALGDSRCAATARATCCSPRQPGRP